MNSIKDKVDKLVSEKIDIVKYDPYWYKSFKKESLYLKKILPKSIIKRVEHFGSTSIPDISSKPIIDILVEVSSLIKVKKNVVPILISKGYEYYWRPAIGNKPPFYAWFIKRNKKGIRTHHIHMVEADSELWDRLYFRDYLIKFPKVAKKYEKLKLYLSKKYSNDRIAYTEGKTKFILDITRKAKKYFKSNLSTSFYDNKHK